MAVSQLAYLGIGVSDMSAWKSFATDILGMQIVERADDGTVYLRMTRTTTGSRCTRAARTTSSTSGCRRRPPPSTRPPRRRYATPASR